MLIEHARNGVNGFGILERNNGPLFDVGEQGNLAT